MGEEVTLTWFGHSMFLAEDSRVKLATDPFDEKVGYPLPEVEANAVLVSHEHFDHNNISLGKGFRHAIRDTEPFSMGTAKNEGCPSYHDDAGGQKRGKNIIFKWNISGDMCRTKPCWAKLKKWKIILPGCFKQKAMLRW